MSFNEWITIIGVITGLIAVIGTVIRLLREKPNLKIEVLKHDYRLELERHTLVSIFFNVDNVGDRGTQLKTLDVSFRYNGKSYTDKIDLETCNKDKTFVDAHKSAQIEGGFFFQELKIASNATLDCVFTLHHTHGKKTFNSSAPYPKPALSKEWQKPS